MTVDLWMPNMIMLVLMTLAFIHDHSRSANAKHQCFMLKQATRINLIKLATTVGHLLRDPALLSLCKCLYDLPILFYIAFVFSCDFVSGLIGDKCSMLPYTTGISKFCTQIIMHLFWYEECLFLLTCFCKLSDIDKLDWRVNDTSMYWLYVLFYTLAISDIICLGINCCVFYVGCCVC